MAVVRKSITFTEQLNEWVQSVISHGDYANESEYIRDLIRHDKENRRKLMALRQAIQEGLDSGVSTSSVSDIIKETKAEMKANGSL